MRRIGIGYEFYKEFKDNDLYYVDKTGIIKDLREKGGKVTLFTRPRRFGKTLTLTMLKAFFEIKRRKKFSEMKDGIQEAIAQIKEKRYEEGILDDGYVGAVSYAVCFCRKACVVELMTK